MGKYGLKVGGMCVNDLKGFGNLDWLQDRVEMLFVKLVNYLKTL